MSNIVIVSNRLPVTVKKTDKGLEFTEGQGGLATSMSFYTRSRHSKWIGWPGIAAEELTEDEKHFVSKELARYHCYPVFLSKKQVDAFYNGFSNTILWPFLHNLPADFAEHDKTWRMYRQVNQRFADVVIALSQPKSTVWVHDYHLMLLPQLLREERPHDSIGFFLHTPFPDAISYEGLPHGKSLIKGLLGADLVGFHTPTYANHFLDSCDRLGTGIVSDGQVALPERVVQVTDFPISIDYLKFAEGGNSPAVQKEIRKLKRQYGQYKIILTVDRLDLTKGFLERLDAYRQLLKKQPDQHGKVVMIMLAVPSRTELPAYRQLRREVEQLVKDINAEFGTAAWQPIVYHFKSVPFEELSALYQVADIAFVAPIRDGMNLVAKEFVASKPNKNGVLILSQTAGAAQELTDALLVNPAKPGTLVTALSKALTMSPAELQQRLARMQEHLSTHTVHHWANSFMRSLRSSPNLALRTRTLKGKWEDELVGAYRTAQKRLILLDYDGVLVELADKHYQATPPKPLLTLLRKLSADPANRVVVISGRGKKDLETWLGELPITLAVEHGTLIKEGKTWRRMVDSPRIWKKVLRPVLEKFVEETPGSLLEEKDTSLVWHYRRASPYYAQKSLVVMRQALKPALRRYGLKAYSGNKILEFKSAHINKGIVVPSWLKKSPDFIMAIGDDYTDEDMFGALPSEAYTVKVGTGKTAARFRVASYQDALKLLRRLAK